MPFLTCMLIAALPNDLAKVDSDRDGKIPNFLIEGYLVCTGSPTNPVIFTAGNSSAWGGLRISGTARIMHTFFFDGGADTASKFGHSNSQAVLMALPDSDVHVLYGGFLDNIGKAAGFQDANLMMLGVKIYRCDLGIEGSISRSTGALTLVGSDLSQFPDDDQVENDDDNDALRLSGWSSVATIVDSCRLSYGDDDAIDQETAHVVVRRCDLSRFINAGVAASGWGYGRSNGRVTLHETVVERCGQGLEVGYGAPFVTMESVVLILNRVGLVFGDEYSHGFGVGHHGILRATTSTIVLNDIDYVNSFPEHPHRRPWNVLLDKCVVVGVSLAMEYIQTLMECDSCSKNIGCFGEGMETIRGGFLEVEEWLDVNNRPEIPCNRPQLYCAALSAIVLRQIPQHEVEVTMLPLRERTVEMPSKIVLIVDRVRPIKGMEDWHASMESYDRFLRLSVSYRIQGEQIYLDGTQGIQGSEDTRMSSMTEVGNIILVQTSVHSYYFLTGYQYD